MSIPLLFPLPGNEVSCDGLAAVMGAEAGVLAVRHFPDSESEQWVSPVAQAAAAPFVVLQKTRRGDRDVEVSVPEVERWRDLAPVLVDDIISTAHTMIETVKHLHYASMMPPLCAAIHAVFADNAYEELCAEGVERVVTANTISHPSNGIDFTSLLAEGVRRQAR